MKKRFKYKHKAFISYKHSELSRTQAIALESALKRYAKPFLKPPISIFRDEKQMVASNNLDKLIKDGLKSSEYLLFFAEKSAAESIWVQDEIRYWCDNLKRLDKFIIVHVADIIDFNLDKKILDWEKTNALPKNILEKHLKTIPLFIDLTWAKTETQRDLNNIQYKGIINNLTARFRNLTPEKINDEEILTHRKNNRLAQITIFVIVLLSFAAIGFGIYAKKQEREANASKMLIQAYVQQLEELMDNLETKNEKIKEQMKKLEELEKEKESRRLEIEKLEGEKNMEIKNAKNEIEAREILEKYNIKIEKENEIRDKRIQELEKEKTEDVEKILYGLDYIEKDLETKEILLFDGLARAKRNDKWGYVNEKGIVIIDCKFDKAERFKNGVALVEQNTRFAMIDKLGKPTTDWLDRIYRFVDGISKVKKDKEYGFINDKGKLITKIKYNYTYEFSGGFGIIRKGRKHAFINKEGKQISKWYDNVFNFSENIAKVQKNKKFGFINEKGKVVVPIIYSGATSFKNGKAKVKALGITFFIDKKGKKVK